MTTETYAPMDISSLLDSEEMIAEYLTAAAEDENPDVLLLALAEVAKARGMAQVAEAAGLGRESLYKALAPGSHPRFATIQAVLRALNVEIAVRPPPKPAARAAVFKKKHKLLAARKEATKRAAAKRAAAKQRA
jgi:probable addiction module antidote protein